MARNFQLDEAMKKHAQERLAKVAKFVGAAVEARAAFDLDKFRYRCDLVLVHRSGEIRAAEENHDLRQAFDIAAEALEKQARRSRKRRSTRRRTERGGVLAGRGGGPRLARCQAVRVVRTGQLPIRPMTLAGGPALDTADRDFVVFRDATNDKVSVLYRQADDDDYGDRARVLSWPAAG